MVRLYGINDIAFMMADDAIRFPCETEAIFKKRENIDLHLGPFTQPRTKKR